MDSSVKTSTAKVYRVRVNKYNWADITIDEWDSGGSFKCISDYGNYSYIWSSIGEACLREFLISLDYYYFMNKAHHSKGGHRFSIKNTVIEIKNEIIKQRRTRDLTDENARRCFNEAIDEISDINEAEYIALFPNTVIASIVYNDDYESFPCDNEDIPECRGFWDVIWPVICAYWKNELILSGIIS